MTKRSIQKAARNDDMTHHHPFDQGRVGCFVFYIIQNDSPGDGGETTVGELSTTSRRVFSGVAVRLSGAFIRAFRGDEYVAPHLVSFV